MLLLPQLPLPPAALRSWPQDHPPPPHPPAPAPQFSGQTMHFMDGAPVTQTQSQAVQAALSGAGAALPTLLSVLLAAGVALAFA